MSPDQGERAERRSRTRRPPWAMRPAVANSRNRRRRVPTCGRRCSARRASASRPAASSARAAISHQIWLWANPRSGRARRPKAADGKRLHALTIDEPAAAVVQRIFALFLAGAGIFAIAEELTQEGIPCPSAHDPGRNRHRYGLAWSKGAVRAILSNPRYTGRQVWHRASARAKSSSTCTTSPRPHHQDAVERRRKVDLLRAGRAPADHRR